MEPAERRNLGAHYTTEHNIVRTIGPLFLDALTAELAAADIPFRSCPPLATGWRSSPSSNPHAAAATSLVIAYRRIRQLERECLLRIREAEAGRRGKRAAGVGQLSVEAI